MRVDPDARRFDLSVLEAAYLGAKHDVEARYPLDLDDARGPVVRVVSLATYARAHSIKVRLDGDTGGDFGWTGFAAGEIKITGPAVMRHEAFHYLLWKAGYPNHLNAAHEHPVFDEYRDGHWLPKRPSTAAVPAAQPAAGATSIERTAATANAVSRQTGPGR